MARIRIAEVLNCKPWELDDVPEVWQVWAGIALDIDAELSKQPDVTVEGGKGS